MKIIEEITKKTVEGENKTYVARGGPASNIIDVDVSNIDGTVFPTAEAAKSWLISNFTQQIDIMIDKAVKKSIEWYGSVPIEDNDAAEDIKTADSFDDVSNIDSVEAATPHEGDVITLPDGTIGKVRNVIMPNQMLL